GCPPTLPAERLPRSRLSFTESESCQTSMTRTTSCYCLPSQPFTKRRAPPKQRELRQTIRGAGDWVTNPPSSIMPMSQFAAALGLLNAYLGPKGERATREPACDSISAQEGWHRTIALPRKSCASCCTDRSTFEFAPMSEPPNASVARLWFLRRYDRGSDRQTRVHYEPVL